MHECLKIETDRLKDLIEENKNLLSKAFALIRALESMDLEIEKPQLAIAKAFYQPWVAYHAVSRAWF